MTTLEDLAKKLADIERIVTQIKNLFDMFRNFGSHTALDARDFVVRRLAVFGRFRNSVREQAELMFGSFIGGNISERGANVAMAQAVNLEPVNVTAGALNPAGWRFRYPSSFLSGQPNTQPNGLLYVAETATDFYNSSTKVGIRIGYWGTGRIQSTWDNQQVSLYSSLTPILYVTAPADFASPGAAFVRASSWTYSCDERLKQGIVDIRDATKIVRRLAGKRFWEGEREKLGFTAQSVKDVLPEAVVELEDGTLGLDTNAILAVLTSAVAELIKQLENLENERRAANLPSAPDQR